MDTETRDTLNWHSGVLAELERLLEVIIERLGDMSAQDDIDAVTTAMTNASTALDAAAPEIQARLNAGVDTTGLSAAVAPLQAAVAGITALTAAPVTTTTTTSSTGTVTTATTTASTATSAPAVKAGTRRVVGGTGLPGDPVRYAE